MAQKSETGMDVFFIRYRKLIAIMCIILFVGFPFKLYKFPGFGNKNIPETIGYFVDITIYLLVLIWLFTKVRKAYKAVNADAVND